MKNETNNVDTDFPLIHQEDKSICSVDNNIPVDKSLNKNNITNVNENNVIEISKIIMSNKTEINKSQHAQSSKKTINKGIINLEPIKKTSTKKERKLSLKDIQDCKNAYNNPKVNIGYLDFLKKTCGPNKKITFGYKFYDSIIYHFENQLDIAHIVRVNHDVEMIKYLFLSHLTDFDDMFKIKVSIQDILTEDIPIIDNEDEIKLTEKSSIEKRNEEINFQKRIKVLFQMLKDQITKKKIIEDEKM